MQGEPNPHQTIEQQREHFESVSEDYYSATQHPNCLAFNRFIWRRFLIEHAHILPQSAKVLEPMCGHGVAKEYLEQNLHQNFTYTGFDYSQNLVDIAKIRMPEAHVFLQDVTSFEPTEKYDLIFLSGGLHHVFDHTQQVLERLRNALVPGGYMLSAEPTFNNVMYQKIGQTIYKNSAKFDDASEERYDLKKLNAHYQNAGFTILDQMYPGLAAYIIAVSAFCFPKLCIGTAPMVERLAKLESPFYRSWLAKKLSFCTFTLLQNP